MIRWNFPSDRPFNVIDKDGAWCGCTLIAEDEDTITVTARDARTGLFMTVQVLREDIKAVTAQSSSIDLLERSITTPR